MQVLKILEKYVRTESDYDVSCFTRPSAFQQVGFPDDVIPGDWKTNSQFQVSHLGAGAAPGQGSPPQHPFLS